LAVSTENSVKKINTDKRGFITMVKIRLKRMGAKKAPFYRIVVADSRYPRDGRFIEELGIYDPTRDPVVVEVSGDKVQDWIKKGAQPTETVKRLLKAKGIA